MVVCMDKSGKFSLVSREMYLKMGDEHTKKDLCITWERAEKTQHLINAHTSAWLNMSNICKTHSHEDRFRSSCLSNAVSTANMYLLVKDHKSPTPLVSLSHNLLSVIVLAWGPTSQISCQTTWSL